MEEVLYFSRMDGITVEQVRHSTHYNMQTNHFHNEYEVYFLVRGERRFFFNNRSYLAHPGNLILVNENVIHMTQSPSDKVNDDGYERIIFYISKDKMQEFDKLFPQLELLSFFREHYGIFRLNEEQQNKFLSLYYFLKSEVDTSEPCTNTIINLKILLYLANFIRDNKSHPISVSSNNTPKYKMVYSIAHYISAHYAENLSLENVAAQFSLSKYYLCRSFKEVTGFGMNEYIHIQRIQRATQLLAETDLCITDIAGQLGYDSLTHFEKLFKNYMKISPLKYRKTNAKFSYRMEDQVFLSLSE